MKDLSSSNCYKTALLWLMLHDKTIRAAKGGSKTKKVFDHGGLYLEIKPSGKKYWKIKFRFRGKENKLSIGSYPELSLLEARGKLIEAKKALINGVDPSVEKKNQKILIPNFKTVAMEWHESRATQWSQLQGDIVKSRLERFVYPAIGQRPVDSIEPTAIIALLKAIEAKGKASTAKRTKFVLNQIFDYIIVLGFMKHNPIKHLKNIIVAPKTKHFVAIIDQVELGKLLYEIDNFKCYKVLHYAMRLAPLVFVRPGELRLAKWKDIDLEKGIWSFFITKTQTDHVVPLARQAIEMLKELYFITGQSEYVFPAKNNNKIAIGEKALGDSLKALGTSITPHGWRATARTLLDEALGARVDVIEAQLAHAVRDSLGTAYNRATFLSERKTLLQNWANFLDKIKKENSGENEATKKAPKRGLDTHFAMS